MKNKNDNKNNNVSPSPHCIFAKQCGVTPDMFNPYDLESAICYTGENFTGILDTEYFNNYVTLRADWCQIKKHMYDAIHNEQHLMCKDYE